MEFWCCILWRSTICCQKSFRTIKTTQSEIWKQKILTKVRHFQLKISHQWVWYDRYLYWSGCYPIWCLCGRFLSCECKKQLIQSVWPAFCLAAHHIFHAFEHKWNHRDFLQRVPETGTNTLGSEIKDQSRLISFSWFFSEFLYLSNLKHFDDPWMM